MTKLLAAVAFAFFVLFPSTAHATDITQPNWWTQTDSTGQWTYEDYPLNCVSMNSPDYGIQVLSVYKTGGPNTVYDNLSTYREIFRRAASIYAASLSQTIGAGGRQKPEDRTPKFITYDQGGGNCQIDFIHIEVPVATLDGGPDTLVPYLTNLGYDDVNRKYFVYANSSGGWWWDHGGYGGGWHHEGMGGEVPSPASNPHNIGGHGNVKDWAFTSTTFYNITTALGRSLNAHTIAHEVAHNLGAVQWSAPDAEPDGGHTYGDTGRDVMNYDWQAGGACTHERSTYRLDCSDNDYFQIYTGSGWSTTRWNIYRSGFLWGGTEQ